MTLTPVRLICASVAALSITTTAFAQSYPSRTVRLIVPSPAGGVTDIMARALAQGLGSAWGQSVVVENRAGAGQIIGAELVAKSPPDGYTLFVSDSSTFAINPHLYRKLPYDALRDFTPIIPVFQIAPVLAVSASVPATNVRDLIALARSKPGALNYGSVGSGSYMHIAMENFKQLTGTNIIHVPYKGSTPAMNAMLAGEIGVFLVHFSVVEQHAKAGKVRLLAAATPNRLALHPELPTVAESGVPGFETGSWFGVLGPSPMPRELVDRIHNAISKLISIAEFRTQYMTRFSFEPMDMTPDQFAQLVKRDFERWAPLVKATGASVD